MQVLGHLGNDCRVSDVNGKKVINFTVASSEKYKDAQGQLIERVSWISCAYWHESRVSDFLKKGVQVFVEGTPSVKLFKNQNGEQVPQQELRVSFIQLLSSNKAQGQPNYSQSVQSHQTAVQELQNASNDNLDDLPF